MLKFKVEDTKTIKVYENYEYLGLLSNFGVGEGWKFSSEDSNSRKDGNWLDGGQIKLISEKIRHLNGTLAEVAEMLKNQRR